MVFRVDWRPHFYKARPGAARLNLTAVFLDRGIETMVKALNFDAPWRLEAIRRRLMGSSAANATIPRREIRGSCPKITRLHAPFE